MSDALSSCLAPAQCYVTRLLRESHVNVLTRELHLSMNAQSAQGRRQQRVPLPKKVAFMPMLVTSDNLFKKDDESLLYYVELYHVSMRFAAVVAQ